MKVYFPNYNKQYENTNESITEIIDDINEFLSLSKGMILSHLLIDGRDVYDDHFQYLMDYVSEISEIEVVVKSQQEVIKELQSSLNEYLDRALPVMKELSDQFYQGESEEAWNNFAELTTGLQWINNALVTLKNFSNEETKDYYLGFINRLEEVLQELADVVKIKDTVTIADLIQYEIIEILTELKEEVHH